MPAIFDVYALISANINMHRPRWVRLLFEAKPFLIRLSLKLIAFSPLPAATGEILFIDNNPFFC